MNATRIFREDESGPRFIIAGDSGAIECRTLAGGAPVLVDYHSPSPQFPGDEATPCDVIAATCYPEAGAGVAALREAWFRDGCNDGVIWRDLEDRYRAWERSAGR